MKKLERKIPVRVTYVGIASLCYLLTPLLTMVPTMQDHVESIFTAYMALAGLITASVGGDTWRPSGHTKDATPAASPDGG